MDRHLIVISEDALVYEDLETLKTLPNFGAVLKDAARINRVKSIYPTLTYPCHVTMMTGVYPDKHGVTNNEQPIVGEVTSHWIHYRDWVKAPTIFDVAKQAGLSTAAVYWPVTGVRDGQVSSIDYLVDEIWPQSPQESALDCFVNSGTTPEVMEKVVAPNVYYVDGRQRTHPACEKFINACACAIVREYKPNLLMIHPANVDAYRHETGLFTPKVTHGLHEIDSWFGDLVNATKDAGIYEKTNFVITSDHGQLNIVRSIAPNALFLEHGLIDVDQDGNFVDYRAFCKSCALSTHVYLKDPSDRAVYDKVYALLKWMCDQEVYGVSRVFTAEEVQREQRLAGGFSFVLETDGYTTFRNDWQRPIVRNLDNSDYRFGRATHGHLPEKGPQPTLFAFGPDIKPGVVVEDSRLIDDAPTFARILGLTMENVDGVAVEEILRT